jgi:uncharacterized metal-binding protein YceD (DUF177 family)
MADTPELSRPVRLDRLGADPLPVTVDADEAERRALARRFGLLSLDSLVAETALTRDGDRVGCSGTLRAAVVQACVASGEPVPAAVEEAFALRFVPTRDDAAAEEIELDSDDLDTVEYEGGAVDVGEAVAQTLALALDPFPRAPGAEQALQAAGVVGEEDVGPFAALKALKGRL